MKNICVIDDDKIYQYLTSRVISDTIQTKDVGFFSNGLDAINYLSKNSAIAKNLPDIIFLDLSMPVMDGWSFLNNFITIQTKLAKKISIYIVSSSNDSAAIQKFKSLDLVTDFIPKPITKDTFLKIIHKNKATMTS